MLPGTNADIREKSKGVQKTDQKRRYSPAFKRQVVKETLAPGASVSIVARRHDINSNVVFRWRQEYRDAERDKAAQAKKGLPAAGFVEVGLVDNAGAVRMLPAPLKPGGESLKAVAPVAEGTTPGLIEIETAGGVKVRISGRVDHRALNSVLAAVRRLA
jgi:transposase